ncbi:MAG: micrococcal nuclease [Kosmotoga sp.]|nr:micrococcal nuclease [Kosmotoga sp.]
MSSHRSVIKQSWLYVSLVILVSISALFLTSCIEEQPSSSLYYVTEILDGDTIKILYNGSEVSVRYIGIDTPETHEGTKPVGEFGIEAMEFNRDLISESKGWVHIEWRGFDYYDRRLGYVYTQDDRMINVEIIRNGLARPLTYTSTSEHSQDFKEAYIEAYENRRGIFSKYDPDSDDPAPTVEASVVKNNLDDYLGKIIWLKFTVTYAYKYEFGCSDAIVEIRDEEADLFFGGNPNFYQYLGKEVKVYGEIWEEDGKPEILLRAPFEIKPIGE